MTVFGDNDPEDAYDASDPLDVRAMLAGRVIVSIVAERAAAGRTYRVLARIIAARRIVNGIFHELED